MENLSKEEVVKIIQQMFKDRPKVNKPTEWYCVLSMSNGYITLCTALTIPKGSRNIIRFDAEYPELQPNIKRIEQAVDNEWMYLSLIKRSNYEDFLKKIQKEDSS